MAETSEVQPEDAKHKQIVLEVASMNRACAKKSAVQAIRGLDKKTGADALTPNACRTRNTAGSRPNSDSFRHWNSKFFLSKRVSSGTNHPYWHGRSDSGATGLFMLWSVVTDP